MRLWPKTKLRKARDETLAIIHRPMVSVYIDGKCYVKPKGD